DLVSLGGELHGQRQPDLPQCDDTDFHVHFPIFVPRRRMALLAIRFKPIRSRRTTSRPRESATVARRHERPATRTLALNSWPPGSSGRSYRLPTKSAYRRGDHRAFSASPHSEASGSRARTTVERPSSASSALEAKTS